MSNKYYHAIDIDIDIDIDTYMSSHAIYVNKSPSYILLDYMSITLSVLNVILTESLS